MLSAMDLASAFRSTDVKAPKALWRFVSFHRMMPAMTLPISFGISSWTRARPCVGILNMLGA